MHELTLAQRLLDRALCVADEYDAAEIETLTVEVGTATHIAPRQLRFCLEAVAEGTKAAAATVEFERVRARGTCDCGWCGTLTTLSDAGQRAPSVRCPSCGERVSLTAGRECRLRSIEVPDPADSETISTHT
ncbi:hydrogenase maturation nickel metallochaperone HypA [Halovenus sp. WSH3]|uniref:Hydrogenase maturation factor HypA n=1 Tax=Halovenus carboxidivorans TaxID=2692199 RepID=A0A6B0T3N0_9EURY|nr:hydrogenase maturation nickel metallochaperone HypA [Halovenus carboxidivorans]MXR52664.1 hydrogenase maturation nickel metallochaperone HypA [Halovenus carboxidivorans]